MLIAAKNWDEHVIHAEEVARGAGFQGLRDRILEWSAPQTGEQSVDVGAGTGLLSLALADAGVGVRAVDISPSMCEYLRSKAASAGYSDVEVAVGSAVSLPLVDECADLVVSNYCFHHLGDGEKMRALREVHRVLRPGGRVVFGDMMFGVTLAEKRDRRVIASKVRAMVRKGPFGVLRLAKNGARLASGRWEQPARSGWWQTALTEAGFEQVVVEVLNHEGGVAKAFKPCRERPS